MCMSLVYWVSMYLILLVPFFFLGGSLHRWSCHPFPTCMPFISSFSYLIALTRISRTMLYRDGENRHLIITNLGEIEFAFPLLIMILAVGFFMHAISQLDKIICCFYFMNIFVMNKCWISSNAFFLHSLR